MANHKTVRTPVLDIVYEEKGTPEGTPIILLHGFPDDIRAWDVVARDLAQNGFRTFTPYLRGFGPTRFVSDSIPRSGQQAALGQDVIEFADALKLSTFFLAGFDWGGRAASISSALAPQRVLGLVVASGNHYPIYQNRAPVIPFDYSKVAAYWYQWFLNLPWGQVALETERRKLCRHLWNTWSPCWQFSDEEFDATAKSWDNPDFVNVVVHSYRHRHGHAEGDPRYQTIEKLLIKGPEIPVPTILLPGSEDGVDILGDTAGREKFTGFFSKKTVEKAGHFVPREKPEAVIKAVLELRSKISSQNR